jgi:translation initiation factor 2B subunit (eIF-2B alpha/beta/delta family)
MLVRSIFTTSYLFSVMANGGLLAPSGTHSLALAAKFYSVPFIVCTGLYKLCPLFAFDQETFNDLKSPSAVLPFEDAETLESVQVVNPAYDYVPPDLISLYVTNGYFFIILFLTFVQVELIILLIFIVFWQNIII